MSTVESKHGAEILKQTQAMAEMFKDVMPKINTNKNGYEIRTDVLKLASVAVWKDYYAKWDQFEKSIPGIEKSPARVALNIDDDGTPVATVTLPGVPGTDEVLEAAEKFYAFINGKPNNK